jgi:hypothetical protein
VLKYSTKQNYTWTIEGVTYQRIIAPNINSKDGLSKEIENREQEHGFEQWSGVFFGRESEVGGGRISGGLEGPTPCHNAA